MVVLFWMPQICPLLPLLLQKPNCKVCYNPKHLILTTSSPPLVPSEASSVKTVNVAVFLATP